MLLSGRILTGHQAALEGLFYHPGPAARDLSYYYPIHGAASDDDNEKDILKYDISNASRQILSFYPDIQILWF